MSIPLSLYIHIPWCERKCPYCDFNSHQAKNDINELAYVDALLLDLDADLRRFGSAAQRPVQTVFIGGGTPSLFSAEALSKLFAGLKTRLEFDPNVEITLEANPGSSEVEKFEQFRELGINRLSIGVQSFNDTFLRRLGRVHSATEALSAADAARNAGFERINLDLMFGLPGQTLVECLRDVETAISQDTTHLSCYQLTIEPNTLFAAKPPITPNDDALWDMQEALQAKLFAAGFEQYEVSAYCRQDQACRHNLNYWRFGDYLGIGAGAHMKITDQGEVWRGWKVKHPASYLDKVEKRGGLNRVAADQLAFEFMLNALRLRQGFSTTEFEQRTLLKLSTIAPILHEHQSRGLLSHTGDRIQATARGHNLLNSMLEDYLP